MAKTRHPVRIAAVDDVVAEDWWEYRRLGRKRVAREAVGRPAPDPSGQDWYCPLFLEHELKGWLAVYGVGPVDALMNALGFVHKQFEALAPSPQGGASRTGERGELLRKRSEAARKHSTSAPEPSPWAFATFTIERRRTQASFGLRWIVCTSIHLIGKTVKASVTIWPPKGLSPARATKLRRLGFERTVTASLRSMGYRGEWQPTDREGITFGAYWKHKLALPDVGRERRSLDGFALPRDNGERETDK